MVRRRVYVAFDYDDLDVKQNLVAQSQRPECPFTIDDSSIARAMPGRWELEAERLIAASDCVLVLCGVQTHQAPGVAIELQITQQLGKRYFLVRGTRQGTPTSPRHARSTDQIWAFRWPTLAALLDGRTPPSDAAW